MKSVKKQYIIGFLLVILIGAGLLIGGVIRYTKKSDLIEIEATVLRVQTRVGDDGLEYRPISIQYFVDGKKYTTSTVTWFDRIIREGDTMYVRYKKGDPSHPIVSNATRDTISIALMACGGILTAAGIALTGKYLYDVKRHKNV
ncbi:MAG: DUF3592 domain-containing protein [Clostridia bacterium]|nr:DUF3592 domain-containing protein [Clostridia bacterium]